MSPLQIARLHGVDRGTVQRWITHGVMVRGRRIRLEAVRVGGRWEVTIEELDAFERRATAAAIDADAPARGIARPRQRPEDVARWRRRRTIAELAAMGMDVSCLSA